MALFITHGIFASLLSYIWRDKKTKFTVFILIFISSILPDIDFIFDGKGSGMFTHRGITHSLFFSAVIGVLFSALFLSSVKSFGESLLLMFIFFLASASHSCLDAMTNATYGVCFFCPFDDDRYFFPITPFSAYTIGSSHKGFRPGLGNSVWGSILPEIIWVWIPTFGIYMISYYFSNKSGKNSSGDANNQYKPIQFKPKNTATKSTHKPSSKKRK